jgi:uncharacterized membrane protein
MVKVSLLLFLIFIVTIASIGVIPVFAEVTSLKDDKALYVLGNKIHFTGTVDISDYQKLVNLVIHDPTGKFVVILGNYSDSTYTFEVTVNTNNTAEFSKQGTYTAIAFTGKESGGKILNFDFSLDGSPVIHSAPQNTNNIPSSLSPPSQHFQSQISENVGIGDVSGNLTKVEQSTTVSSENSSNPYSFKTILYPIISLCGAGIVVAVLYNKKRIKKTKKQKLSETTPSQSPVTKPESEDDYALMILKNRLAKGEITIDEFQTIKDALSES